MGLFNFRKKNKTEVKSQEVKILRVERTTNDAVKIIFDSKDQNFSMGEYIPGQYIPVEIELNGEKHRRSYSICSSLNENMAIGVKRVESGIVSNYLNDCKEGQFLKVFKPEGKFTTHSTEGKIVCIAAGSGITPILSIIKSNPTREFVLYYGNKTKAQTMFLEELIQLKNVVLIPYYSQEQVDNSKTGRITKEAFVEEIKTDLSLLQASEFFICGPHQMIKNIQEALKMFGVAENKIHFELFTVSTEAVDQNNLTENSSVDSFNLDFTLDDEQYSLEGLNAKKTILEHLDSNGIDAPYSCRGGVCSSCKAKVLEGRVDMKVNYSLTDEEIEEGYVLTCQALCQSNSVKITFDE